MSALVSVLVPVRNAAAELPELLDTLAAQTLPREEFEVVIVDDASRDDTAEVAEAHPVGARVVRAPSWGGAYAARNLGLPATRGEIVALTDGDCRPAPDWIENARTDLERLDADLLAGHVESPLSERPGTVELLDYARHMDQERTLREAGFGATANLIVKRSVFDRIGPFNHRLISAGDREFCLRAREAGFRIEYSRAAAVRHDPRATALGVARRGFRDGVGRIQSRRHGHDVIRNAPRIWSRPGAWIPSALIGRSEPVGVERLAAGGHARKLRRIAAAEYFLIQLPMVAGSLYGSLRAALRRD